MTINAILKAILLLSGFILCAACGQTGPLCLPEETNPCRVEKTEIS